MAGLASFNFFWLILFLLFLTLLLVLLLLLICELAISSSMGGSVESMVLAPMESLAVSFKSSLSSGRSFLLPSGDLVLLLPLLPSETVDSWVHGIFV